MRSRLFGQTRQLPDLAPSQSDAHPNAMASAVASRELDGEWDYPRSALQPAWVTVFCALRNMRPVYHLSVAKHSIRIERGAA